MNTPPKFLFIGGLKDNAQEQDALKYSSKIFKGVLMFIMHLFIYLRTSKSGEGGL